MQVIAKTSGGFMVEATENEIREILRSVNGEAPKEVSIGQKMPAIDYAGSIANVKELHQHYRFTRLVSSVGDFVKHFNSLKDVVSDAANLEA